MFYEEKLGENRNNAGTIFWLNNLQNNRWSNEQSFKFDYQPQTQERRSLTAAELPRLSDMKKADSTATINLPRFDSEEE